MRTYYVVRSQGLDLERHSVIGSYRERFKRDAVFKFIEDFKDASDYWLVKFVKGKLHVLASV